MVVAGDNTRSADLVQALSTNWCSSMFINRTTELLTKDYAMMTASKHCP